jgi:hypothetical protein
MTVTGGWEECVQIHIPKGMSVYVRGCRLEYYKDFIRLELPQGKKAQLRFSTL